MQSIALTLLSLMLFLGGSGPQPDSSKDIVVFLVVGSNDPPTSNYTTELFSKVRTALVGLQDVEVTQDPQRSHDFQVRMEYIPIMLNGEFAGSAMSFIVLDTESNSLQYHTVFAAFGDDDLKKKIEQFVSHMDGEVLQPFRDKTVNQ